MNYTEHYRRLMKRAEDRVLEGYYERHHVVPRCIDKASKRTVRLTPEEHYVAHQLLTRIYPGNYRLIFAAVKMTQGNANMPRSNKMYGWLRRAWNKASSEAAKDGWQTFRSWATPEQISLIRREAALASNTAEVRAKKSAGSKAYRQRLKADPIAMAAYSEIQSLAQKKRFANPVELERHRLAQQRPETILKHSQDLAARNTTEVMRKKVSAGKIAFYESHPEARAWNSTEEARAKNSLGLYAAWEKKKEAEALLSQEEKDALHQKRSEATRRAWLKRKAVA